MNTSWLWQHWSRFVQHAVGVAWAVYWWILIVTFLLLAITALLVDAIIALIHHVSVQIYLRVQDLINVRRFMPNKTQCSNVETRKL
jgi:hypothetical protein